MSTPRLRPEPLDPEGRRGRRTAYPRVSARPGLVVEHRPSGTTGAVLALDGVTVTLRDRHGRDHRFRLGEGMYALEGRPCTLIAPPATPAHAPPARTASGSVAVPDAPARIARASRILVEGVHDAELVERVWGDDLRVEGVVVERLDGMDDLTSVIRGFGPRPGRRLGILLDHLVEGSKEQRAAEAVDHPDVLVTGHPFVDVWAAVRPSIIGLDAWPDIPKGQPWKEGVCRHVGVDDPGRLWRQILAGVTDWRDLDPTLVGAVERLIDFVTEPA
ncbi:MAG TPA: DUF3097 family protein [Acidimicrobiales bacterium]|nr:DUF3097 family protein [Acidimicrobiales bacterium]